MRLLDHGVQVKRYDTSKNPTRRSCKRSTKKLKQQRMTALLRRVLAAFKEAPAQVRGEGLLRNYSKLFETT